MKTGIYRIWYNIRGLLFFLAVLVIPALFLFITKVVSDRYATGRLNVFIREPLFLITLNYLLIFGVYFILKKIFTIQICLFSAENWFVTMGKAFRPALISFFVGFVSLIAIIQIFEILPLPESVKSWMKIPNQGYLELFDGINDKNALKIMIWFCYIIVVAPVAEEIIFRGFLQDSLGKFLNKFNADLIITSLIFSLFHINSLSNALYSFIIGIFLSLERKKSGYINVSVWVHVMINFTGLFYGILVNYLSNN
ncbi:MAG TPA: type II CAAX endopeptidase family protein [Spirochaetota bacterium]|nr:type II CAAX endopeptidase family protein [Spirochaetota bacterium]HOS32661.1 type II CAAX endopeptidase family protein [Spirochaetota bacterium]HOS54712.1 type II CAAX endopeptidase family protein [Spirochaetota bacterium]HPK61335.1 type II CAAX endopeptidase family protein [Spirochaetota bacterium]HQF76610.1 type II CAAX endopeptidase family protein [Spirochaetota bacterium]